MNHKGQPCPYREITCQEGICPECQVWQDRLIELRKRWIKLRQDARQMVLDNIVRIE